MKKILFLMRYPLVDKYNLKYKFDGQMRACVNLGYDVYHLAYDKENYYLCSVKDQRKEVISGVHCSELKNYRSTVGFFDLYAALWSVLKRENFDVIYMRSKMVTPLAARALKHHKQSGGKLIVEIPSYGVQEASLGLIRDVAYMVFRQCEKRVHNNTDLYTLIGENCPAVYEGKPAIEISNGISVDVLPMRIAPAIGTEIHMLAVASMRDWQGYDRVVEGMHRYSGPQQLFLHLVGTDEDGSVGRWRQKAEEYSLASHVIYHGALYGDDLTNVFNTCHLALGTMAMHRKGGLKASTLKIREYSARGIPFIYGYIDTGLTGNEWFAQRIPADDSPLDFDSLIPWLLTLEKEEHVSERIRQYAFENLSWEQQFRRILGDEKHT